MPGIIVSTRSADAIFFQYIRVTKSILQIKFKNNNNNNNNVVDDDDDDDNNGLVGMGRYGLVEILHIEINYKLDLEARGLLGSHICY